MDMFSRERSLTPRRAPNSRLHRARREDTPAICPNGAHASAFEEDDEVYGAVQSAAYGMGASERQARSAANGDVDEQRRTRRWHGGVCTAANHWIHTGTKHRRFRHTHAPSPWMIIWCVHGQCDVGRSWTGGLAQGD
ncbi:hypothetical protein MMC20_007235 [Loxospora ochrophaea]|nr:hypothetical protein [Loxospora ochrophaea]